jgi:polygalacturonase
MIHGDRVTPVAPSCPASLNAGRGGASGITCACVVALACALLPTAANAEPKPAILTIDCNAACDGSTLMTPAIQKAIDTAAPAGGTVTFKPGTYLTGALFLKSGVTLEIPDGVTITGSQDIKDFPELPTRIAGIEMTWPAALINIRDAHDVTLTGKGTIDENGAVWWKVYNDLRAAYTPKGLRWASDYDAKRVRLSLIQNSNNVHYGGGLQLKRSGFWTIQVLYSHDVAIDGVTIRNNDGTSRGPSTDGIDIDSSHDIDVSHADIDNNDDALCLKAGRDSDGLRVNRPTYNIKVHDSIIRRGAAAITIGSETSGGFHNIEVWNLTAESGAGAGVLFKSAHTRGGTATDIQIHDLTLEGVATPISMTMNWNPAYSYATLPAGMDIKTAPPYWVPLTTPVSDAQGRPHFSGVHIWNIKATGARRAFSVEAYPDAPLTNFKFDHLDIQAADAGSIANVKDWTFSDIKLATTNGSAVKVTDATNLTGLPAATTPAQAPAPTGD